MKQEVILVDVNDKETGIMEKLEAHRKGILHRAFSVFIFNSRGKMLIHQRAAGKYHGGGLWTNACCSHPLPGETLEDAVCRRLSQEMGMSCEVRKIFDFVYRAEVENGLTEYEFDHVYVGVTDAEPVPNKDEVQAWEWRHPEEILSDLSSEPERYTIWFAEALPRVLEAMRKNEKS